MNEPRGVSVKGGGERGRSVGPSGSVGRSVEQARLKEGKGEKTDGAGDR